MNNPTDTAQTNNRGRSVVKNTQSNIGATDISIEELNAITDTQELTAEEQKFTALMARGYSATQAYRLAYPHKQLTNGTVRTYASALLTKPDIVTDIAVKKSTLSKLARLAEDRIEDTLINGKTGSKAVTDTMLAMYEHANGKAKQQTEVISKSVSVNIDLTMPLTEVTENS